MRRILLTLIALSISFSGVLASHPGQPLYCSDVVVVVPGFTCEH